LEILPLLGTKIRTKLLGTKLLQSKQLAPNCCRANSCLLGCETIMETRTEFHFSWFTLSLPCSAPCGTSQATIDTGCDPALLRNCVDYPSGFNLFKKYNLIEFARIRPLTLDYNKIL